MRACTVKKVIVFLSPAGMSLTKLSLVGNNLITPGQGEIGWWHPGWGREIFYLFFTLYILKNVVYSAVIGWNYGLKLPHRDLWRIWTNLWAKQLILVPKHQIFVLKRKSDEIDYFPLVAQPGQSLLFCRLNLYWNVDIFISLWCNDSQI
jgi:hypothetical protein